MEKNLVRHSVTKNNEGALDNDLIFRRYISITPFGTFASFELLISNSFGLLFNIVLTNNIVNSLAFFSQLPSSEVTACVKMLFNFNRTWHLIQLAFVNCDFFVDGTCPHVHMSRHDILICARDWLTWKMNRHVNNFTDVSRLAAEIWVHLVPTHNYYWLLLELSALSRAAGGWSWRK